jgi:hypothetical protein
VPVGASMISNLTVVGASDLTAGTATFTVLINGAATGPTCQINTTNLITCNGTTPVTVSPGDFRQVQVTTAGISPNQAYIATFTLS